VFESFGLISLHLLNMKPKQLECGTMSLDVLLSYNFMLNLLSSSVTSAANELAATLNIAAP